MILISQFHVLTRPDLHPTINYTANKLNQSYKAVVEFYYNFYELWNQDHVAIDDISLKRLYYMYVSGGDFDQVSYSLIDHLLYLWKHDEIQYAYDKYKHFHKAMDHLPYFMKRMDKLFATCAKIDDDHFDPRQCRAIKEDFLRAYCGSTWVESTHIDSPLGFTAKNREAHVLYDVGGRVSNRRRWASGALVNCEAVVFVAALDDYCKKS